MEEIKKPDNPSVYPDPMRGADQSYSNQNPWKLESGMTLRDYFAAKALQSIMISENFNYAKTALEMSDCSYKIADAMLKQREL